MEVKRGKKAFEVINVNGVDVLHRQCSCCGEVKSIDNFCKQSTGVHGIRPICNSCKRIDDRNYQRKNHKKINENNRRWLSKNADKKKAINDSYCDRLKRLRDGDKTVTFRKYPKTRLKLG